MISFGLIYLHLQCLRLFLASTLPYGVTGRWRKELKSRVFIDNMKSLLLTVFPLLLALKLITLSLSEELRNSSAHINSLPKIFTIRMPILECVMYSFALIHVLHCDWSCIHLQLLSLTVNTMPDKVKFEKKKILIGNDLFSITKASRNLLLQLWWVFFQMQFFIAISNWNHNARIGIGRFISHAILIVTKIRVGKYSAWNKLSNNSSC